MKQVILDTSFILSCIKNKIDLFEELIEYKLLFPSQVIEELEGISKSKQEAKLALKIIKLKKPKIIDLEGKNTDKTIINYAKKNPDVFVATLDKEIKKSVRNHKIIIRNRKKLEVD
jgi:rRNA-processing protein FCF1